MHKSIPFTDKPPRKPETVIKDWFEQMKHDRENRTTFSDNLLLPEMFHGDDSKSHVEFPLIFHRISRKPFVSDKHPSLIRLRTQVKSSQANFYLKSHRIILINTN